jgi:hypothetical protein
MAEKTKLEIKSESHGLATDIQEAKLGSLSNPVRGGTAQRALSQATRARYAEAPLFSPGVLLHLA